MAGSISILRATLNHSFALIFPLTRASKPIRSMGSWISLGNWLCSNNRDFCNRLQIRYRSYNVQSDKCSIE